MATDQNDGTKNALDLFDELVGRLTKLTSTNPSIKDIVIHEDEPVNVAVPAGLMKLSVTEYTTWTRDDIGALARAFREDWEKAIEENRMDIGIEMGSVNYRCNFFSYDGSLERYGKLGMSIRVFPRELLSLEQLNVPTKVISWFDQKIGWILFVGGTGVGKSTTVAAGIARINVKRTGHIVLIEDPIEFKHKSQGCLITQREIGTNAQSVSDAVRGAMRQSPIVVSTGEIRTAEDAEAALYVGDSGRLAMATSHGSSAIGGLRRIINMFPDDARSSKAEALAGCLNGVLYQVLLPRADGKGWVPGYEYFPVNAVVKKLIAAQAWSELSTQLQDGKSIGDSQSLNADLLRLVRSGQVNPEDAKTCTYNSGALFNVLKEDVQTKHAADKLMALAA